MTHVAAADPGSDRLDRYAKPVYALLDELLHLDAVRSMSYWSGSDIGVLRHAYLALYVDRELRDPRAHTIGVFDPVFPLDFASLPTWMNVVTWWDEGPIKGDLHVVENAAEWHFSGLENGDTPLSNEPKLVMLLPRVPTRRVGASKRHPAYKWYWSTTDVSLGVNELADVVFKITVDRLCQARGLERVASRG